MRRGGMTAAERERVGISTPYGPFTTEAEWEARKHCHNMLCLNQITICLATDNLREAAKWHALIIG